MMESRSLFWHHHKQVARSRSLLAALMLVWGAASHALPTGPQIVNGAAAFIQTPNLLTINNSNNAILNWQQFNIGASEAVRFNQPSANSSVLNRVLGADPSAIYGQLSSNGRVWLINPAGILVGPGAKIDTAAFVASTLNLRNEDFLAGKLTFGGNSNAGSVVNQGAITTPDGGSVYLIAPTVSNEGLITTPKGETILAAGQTVRLIDTATPGVNVEVTGSEGNATNLGSIIAEAGRIGVAGVLVRNSGTLNASSVVNQGGRIFLKARQDTYVDQNARIDSSGSKGGNIEVLGNRVAVTDQAQLDASGQNGGGSVLVGGEDQGKNPVVQNAYITHFGPQASLTADAVANGDGGKVIVWADDTTRAYGSISARGGNKGGNGGTVETSGHWLDAAGIRVNAGSPRGKAGDWLIDPFNIDIQAGSDANISTSAGTFSDSTAGAVLTPTTIQNTMYGSTGADGTNVTVQASGNIVVTSPIATTNTVSRQLKLAAGGSITINNSINLANSSTLLLNAGTFISQSSPGIITATNLGIRALGDVSLNTAPNAVGNLAANIGDSSNQNHNIRFKNNLALNIGSGIDSLSGISISLDSSGFDSTSQNGVIALTSDTGNLAQSAGALLAGKAVVISAKNVSLTESNSTGVIAGNATDASPTFSYKSANAIALSNIAMTNIDTKNGITFTNGSGLVVLDNSGASTAKNIGQSTGAIIGDSTHTASLVLKSKGAAQLSLDNNITNLAATVGSGLSAGSDGMYVKSVQALTVNTSPLDNVTGINANSTSANFGSTVSLTVSNAGGVAPLVTAGKLALGSPSISLTGYSS
ncbi:MAG: filamentous hemagglutinin N-terminal domain-containing protein, partial [Proteobacteria bacterium]|nr:filamentous hemagglutinin N-terminal domain-containing protein [Pseudomonadota bacterium]